MTYSVIKDLFWNRVFLCIFSWQNSRCAGACVLQSVIANWQTWYSFFSTYGSNKELIVNIDSRKIHLVKFIYDNIIILLQKDKVDEENIEEDSLDLCDGEGNLVEIKNLPETTSCIELEDNVISLPFKEWILVIKDEVEIKPLLEKDFWPRGLADKLSQLKAQAIKNRDRKIRNDIRNNRNKPSVASVKARSGRGDDAMSTSSRNTTSRKSNRVLKWDWIFIKGVFEFWNLV